MYRLEHILHNTMPFYLLSSITVVSLMYELLNDFPPNTITQTISLVTLNDEIECLSCCVTDCGIVI